LDADRAITRTQRVATRKIKNADAVLKLVLVRAIDRVRTTFVVIQRWIGGSRQECSECPSTRGSRADWPWGSECRTAERRCIDRAVAGKAGRSRPGQGARRRATTRHCERRDIGRRACGVRQHCIRGLLREIAQRDAVRQALECVGARTRAREKARAREARDVVERGAARRGRADAARRDRER